MTTYHICDVLTDFGYASVAYDLLLNEKCPSWLYEVKQGATTIWESWFGIRENGRRAGSHNHYSFGAVAGWLMGTAAGIRLEDGQLTVAPHPDRRLGFVEAVYHSPMGIIESGWRYEDGGIRYTAKIPPNTGAAWILPGRMTKKLSPGTYTWFEEEIIV